MRAATKRISTAEIWIDLADRHRVIERANDLSRFRDGKSRRRHKRLMASVRNPSFKQLAVSVLRFFNAAWHGLCNTKANNHTPH
jgi:hypothetical protein